MKLLPVLTRNGSGFIDERGSVVIPLLYNECFDFSEGLARFRFGDIEPWEMGCQYGKQGFLNLEGRVVISPSFERAYDFSEGLAVVYQGCHYGGGGWIVPGPWEGGKAGYIDYSGNYAIKPRFEWADSFKDGIARVRDKGKWGFINKSGDFVIEPIYDDAKPFSEGLACVNIGKRPVENVVHSSKGRVMITQKETPGRWGYIDTSGSHVIEPGFSEASSFSEGLAWVAGNEKTNPRRYWNKGRIRSLQEWVREESIIARPISWIEDTAQNLRYVLPWWYCIDTNGNRAFRGKFCSPDAFSEGYASVSGVFLSGDGYVNTSGEKVIEKKFDVAFPFHNGFAQVVSGGEEGVIDKQGDFAIEPIYPRLDNIAEGLAAFKEDEKGGWGFLDMSGRVRIQPHFRSTRPFRNGAAKVELLLKENDPLSWYWTYVDRDGNVLWRPTILDA